MLRWCSHSLWVNLPFLVCAWLLLSSVGLAQSSSILEDGQRGEAGLIGPVNHSTQSLERSPLPKDQANTLDWESGRGRSYLIPAAEVLTYLFLLNQYNRHFIEPKDVYRSTGTTIHEHLTDSKWVFDNDQFSVNQFLHPYGGSVYFGLARSAGLSFWESSLYSVAGSYLWEIGGERTAPSINDMITTPIGGTFLGEPLFRMANLLLETGDGPPGFWRELGAAIISPPTGFNRLVFGNRFDSVYPSHRPATFLRLAAGGTLTSSSRNVSSNVNEHGAVGELEIITYLTPTHEPAILRSSERRIAHDDQADSNTLATDAAVFDRRSLQAILAGTPLA